MISKLGVAEKIGYAVATVEHWLQGFAEQEGLGMAELTVRVAEYFAPAPAPPAQMNPYALTSPVPSTNQKKAKSVSTYWSRMTKAQRSAEMKKRMLVRKHRAQLGQVGGAAGAGKFPLGGVA